MLLSTQSLHLRPSCLPLIESFVAAQQHSDRAMSTLQAKRASVHLMVGGCSEGSISRGKVNIVIGGVIMLMTRHAPHNRTGQYDR
jgi:hypothetical protein